ncbi:hypothetical protein TWF481_009362 [Arthrobotrys musiformis]|uniref:Uncharacterized protein n=1 Tax=Arthrobotrys musiformis TaxID=47236 RepID=A0AAV9W3I7_9PEZI
MRMHLWGAILVLAIISNAMILPLAPYLGKDANTTISNTSVVERAVPPTLFYSNWRLQCPGTQGILRMNPDPDAYITINGNKRPRIDMHPQDQAAVRRRKGRIRSFLDRCNLCKCDQIDGTLIMDPTTRAFRDKRPNYHTEYTVMQCRFWWNCHCVFQMKSPDRDDGIPVEEYQDALDNVPFAVKQQNPAWRWNPASHPGFSMSWQGLAPRQHGQADKEMVPGMDEPYYLEGPDYGWREKDSLSGLREMFGPGPGIFGSKVSKRDTSDIDDTTEASGSAIRVGT